MPPITERIEQRRKERGLSVTNLAQAAGIPRQTLGRRLLSPEDFTVKELGRIASVLGTTAATLLYGSAA
jgi:transcriptional regulator with XRE-family HTH domain